MIRRARRVGSAVVIAATVAAATARAQEPVPPSAPAQLQSPRTEVGGLPLLSYDSDTGLLVGAIVNVARFTQAEVSHAWRLEAVLSASVKNGSDGPTLPLHDDSFSLDLPGLRGGALRVGAEAHFRRFTDAAWFGPGGDSSAEVPATSTYRFHRYTRLYPGASINTRWRLCERRGGSNRRRLELLLGGQLEYSNVTPDPGSLLERQLAIVETGTGPDAEALRDVLRGVDPHTLGKLRIGVLFDSRDHEFQPTRGVFLELSTRVAPVPASLRHVGLFASAAGFIPLRDERWVLGARFFADALVGDPPFYALTEAGVASPKHATGGGSTVRGVLLQRFAGKIKIVGGVELRAQLFHFNLAGQRSRLGAATFVDAGRTWADWHRVTLDGRDVDGPWFRFAVGTGGGVRLGWGETLVIRTDLAWSPTERTQGLYLVVGQIF